MAGSRSTGIFVEVDRSYDRPTVDQECLGPFEVAVGTSDFIERGRWSRRLLGG